MDLSRTSDSQGFIKNSQLTLNYPRPGEGHLVNSPYTHSKETTKEILSSQGLLNSMALNFSTKVEGQHSSFPYGISGVAMRNYAYTGDLYQFTSNGYPRKSRTCSYCAKVFTRSTTRRYHEKRCPRLRAAVCGIVQDDDKKSKFPQLPSPHGRNNLESTTSGYDKLSGTSLKPHSASTSKSSSKFKRDDSLENQTSVNVKKETQDHLASFYGDKLHSRDLMPDSHHLADLHSALAAYKQSNFRSMSLSPFNLGAAMDFNKSPSRTSSGQRDDQESVSNDEMPNTNGSDIENFETLRQSIENDDLKFDEMNKRMKRESPSSEAGMMGNINENGKSEQNNNGENLDQSGNGLDIKCGVCGKMFASSWQLHVHEQIHTKFKPYACRFCGERFSKAALRINHERIHETGTNEGGGQEADGSSHVCAICGSSFMKKDSLRFHIHKNHQVGPWLCRNCGKAAISHQDLFDHLKSHDLPPTETESLQYLQDIANGMFAEESINGINNEMDDEELEGEAEMNEPDSNENLTSPEQDSPSEMPMSMEGDVDSNEEKEMCNICGRDIPKSHMGYHLKSHEGQKPYECPICKKRFGYKNNMKSHIKLHDGIKSYQCNICGAKFTRGSTLRRHARRHGISAESVWDLFVKNDSQQSNHVTSNQKTETMNLSGSSEIPNSKFTDTSPYSNFNSLFSLPTSVAMSNALFMNYHNQAMAGASLPSLFSLQSTSEIPPPSAGFDTSSQSEQKDALNLSVHKDAGTDNEIPSPTSISRSRSRSLSGSESMKNDVMDSNLKIDSSDVGVQVKSCCKMGSDIFPLMAVRSPSEASIQSGDSAATSQGANLAALENSTDNVAALIAAGKLYKCELWECYFSEYAMYRIHSKIHPGGRMQPFCCPICSEDCHDKVYFSLHVSEHLH